MKQFTVDEANAALAMVEPLVEAIRDAQQSMEQDHDAVAESVPGNGGGGAGVRYLEANRTIARATAELETIGVVVRDPSTGLVDFPAERDGEQIFLCWRLGEDAVAWWHPTDSGFAGRQPL